MTLSHVTSCFVAGAFGAIVWITLLSTESGYILSDAESARVHGSETITIDYKTCGVLPACVENLCDDPEECSGVYTEPTGANNIGCTGANFARYCVEHSEFFGSRLPCADIGGACQLVENSGGGFECTQVFGAGYNIPPVAPDECNDFAY